MSKRTRLFRIHQKLRNLNWIGNDSKTTNLLFKIINREGLEFFEAAIEDLQRENYTPKAIHNIGSRHTILLIGSRARELKYDLRSKVGGHGMKDIVKDILDNDRD